MTRQYLDMNVRGTTYNIIFHAGKTNPFHIVKKWFAYDGEQLKRKTQTVEKYADLKSCLLWLLENVPNTEG